MRQLTCKEIMVGDFILAPNGNPCRIFKIKSLDYGNNGEINHNRKEEGFLLEDACPIPITTEILGKNGFKVAQFFEELFYQEYLIQCDYYNVRIKTFSRELIDIPCRYVHELQHALRLCGIKKEIVL